MISILSVDANTDSQCEHILNNIQEESDTHAICRLWERSLTYYKYAIPTWTKAMTDITFQQLLLWAVKIKKICLWLFSLLNGIIGLFSLWTHLEVMSLSLLLSLKSKWTLRKIPQTITTVLKRNFCFPSPKEHEVETFSSKKQAKQHIVTKPVDVDVVSAQRIKITAWTLLLCLPTD